MPLTTLNPHPSETRLAIERITVEVLRPSPSRLSLRYQVLGDVSSIVVPGWVERSRADELWRTTCFEVFVRRGEGPGYLEFNASPSGQWAAYGFDDYRQGMTPQNAVELERLDRSVAGRTLTLSAVLDLGRIGLAPAPWRLAISAVIEDQAGSKSYWALAHPSDKPDFHHPDSFVLELA